MMKRRLTALLLAALLAMNATQGLALQPTQSLLDSSGQVQLDSGLDSGMAQNPSGMVYTQQKISVSDLFAQIASRGRSAAPTWYGERLSGETRLCYDSLLQWAQEIQENSSMPSYFDLRGETTGLDSSKIFGALIALIHDYPNLFYWFEKGEEAMAYTLIETDSDTGFQNIYLILPVVAQYRGTYQPLTLSVDMGGGETQQITYDAWTVTPNRGGEDAKALLIADEIVKKARNLPTPYEKIRFFNQQICALTEYNFDSLLPGASYDGAYQMFDVFLGRPVVCEGYSKAFWYLCNEAGIPCVLISGKLFTNGESGNHMWNAVMLDGAWYLVDVTNNDVDGDIEWLLAIGLENQIMQHWKFSPDTIVTGDGESTQFDLVLSRTDYQPPAQKDDTSGGGSDDTPPVPKSLLAQKIAADGQSLARKTEQAAAKGEASVLIKDALSITPWAMRQVADAARGNPMTIYADVTDERGIALRFYLDPVKGAALSNELLLTARVDDPDIAAIFSHHFGQTVTAVTFEHMGEFGMPVSVAVRFDLSQLDEKNLQFYLFDRQANTYCRLADLPYTIDSAGYLHLTLTQGKTLVITDRPLLKQ